VGLPVVFWLGWLPRFGLPGQKQGEGDDEVQ
jgi:hypothetical protein